MKWFIRWLILGFLGAAALCGAEQYNEVDIYNYCFSATNSALQVITTVGTAVSTGFYNQVDILNYCFDSTNSALRIKFVDNQINLTPRTAPSTPTEGTIYYDSGTKKLRVYDGTSWNNCY